MVLHGPGVLMPSGETLPPEPTALEDHIPLPRYSDWDDDAVAQAIVEPF